MTVPYSPEIEALPDTAVGTLVTTEAVAQETIAQQLVASLLALWATFSAFYDGDAVAKFGQRSGQLVRAAQQQTGAMTEQHLRRQFQRLEVPLPRSTVVSLPTDLRLGSDTADVYQRPVRKVRYLVSEQMPEAEAVQVAVERLEAQALTDLQLARVTAAQQMLYAVPDEGPTVTTGWRRIIHPELGSVCGLCIAASDRVYQKIERMSIHPACRCTVLPVVVTSDGEVRDPGRTLNAADLESIYKAAAGGGNTTGTTSSRALAQTRIQVKENGELGTILMADGSAYKDMSKVQNQLSPAAASRRRDSIEAQIRKLRAIENPNQWYLDRIEQLEELAAAA